MADRRPMSQPGLWTGQGPSRNWPPPATYSSLRRSWRPLLKQAGLPYRRFHSLRHTHASMLLSEGVHPKVVQERLGHATISITLDTYSHVMSGLGREAASKLDSLLGAI